MSTARMSASTAPGCWRWSMASRGCLPPAGSRRGKHHLGDFAEPAVADLRAVIELGLLQVIKGGSTTFDGIVPERLADIFDIARRMRLRFYGAPYVFSTARMV